MTLPGEPPLSYTVLFTRGEEGDVTRLLLAAGETRLELSSAQDQGGGDSTESLTDPVTKERFSRRLLLTGYETVPACAAVRPPDACLVFSGARGSVAASLSAFSGENASALRARVAALVSRAFDAKLSVLVSAFSRTAELIAYGGDFLSLVWPGRFPPSPRTFAKGTKGPGCEFDAAFGYPCTEAERRRERSPTK